MLRRRSSLESQYQVHDTPSQSQCAQGRRSEFLNFSTQKDRWNTRKFRTLRRFERVQPLTLAASNDSEGFFAISKKHRSSSERIVQLSKGASRTSRARLEALSILSKFSKKGVASELKRRLGGSSSIGHQHKNQHKKITKIKTFRIF